jgi:hypothetical protein
MVMMVGAKVPNSRHHLGGEQAQEASSLLPHGLCLRPLRASSRTGLVRAVPGLLRRKTAYLDEFQAERFGLGEHAVKRGLVGQHAGQHGVPALRPGLEGGERGTDRLAQVAADTDLVPLQLGIAVRTSHLLTMHRALTRARPVPG